MKPSPSTKAPAARSNVWYVVVALAMVGCGGDTHSPEFRAGTGLEPSDSGERGAEGSPPSFGEANLGTGQGIDPPAGFQDVSGPLAQHPVHGDDYGVLAADFDNDGRTDLMFMGHSLDPLLLAGQGGAAFTDRSDGSGIRPTVEPDDYFQQDDRHGAACADFDNDGFSDVFISHGAYRGATIGLKFDELLRGRGDFTFEDVSRQASMAGGLLNARGRGRTGRWADYDNDGFVDLYITNFESPNAMYRNNGDGTFSDVTATTGLGLVAFRAAWSDFDQDGNIDLLVASPLRLLRNDGAGAFEDVTRRLIGEQELFGYGLAWADLDSDGDQDFVMSALSAEVYVFVNEGGRFERMQEAAFVAEGTVRVKGVAPADIDNDGDIDLIQSTSHGISLLVNVGDMQYTLWPVSTRAEPDLVRTHGDIAIADHDGDGLVDFATDDVGAYRVYRNSAANANHWLQVRLDGTTTGNNAMGFGARIRVTVDGSLVGFHEYTGSSAGLRSHGCSAVHIGLGSHESVDIDVLWPNGRVTSLGNVDVDRSIVISE